LKRSLLITPQSAELIARKTGKKVGRSEVKGQEGKRYVDVGKIIR
jgi:hypothetical protein